MDLRDLATTVAELEAQSAVRGVLNRYLNANDSSDLEGLAQLFTEDATVEMVGLDDGDGAWSGRRSIVDDFFTGFDNPTAPTRASGHYAANTHVEVAGEQASLAAYFFEVVYDDLLIMGRYLMKLRLDDRLWRISHFRIAIHYMAQLATVEPRIATIRHTGRGLDQTVTSPLEEVREGMQPR